VKLEEIILSLNKNNLSSLFLRLSASKCPRARTLVKKLIRGEDFYDSLGEFFDKIGAQMLALRNFTGFRLLQKYLVLKSRLYQQLKFALLYPIILLVIQVILLLFISKFLKINWFHLLWIFCINALVILGICYYLNNLQKDLLLFHLFENLLNNELDYHGFRRCYLLFRKPRVNVLKLRNVDDLARTYLGISYINQENFSEKKQLKEEKIKDFLRQIPRLMAGLLSINVVILCVLAIFAYSDFLGNKIGQFVINKTI
jgi:hypothetical protein